MARGIAVINGRNIAHQDLVIQIAGVPITSISDISTNKTQVKEFSYGTQELPVGYGIGKKEAPELTFTMSKKDADALQGGSPNRDILDLAPFDIPLTVTSEDAPRFSIIKNILIQGVEESSDEDTTDIKVAFTCVCSHIQNIF
jgi:hypothetical protein